MRKKRSKKSATSTNNAYQAMIIGGYPPPMGGVTIHIKRFYEYCQKKGVAIKIITPFNSVPNNDGVILRGYTSFGKLVHLLLEIRNFSGKMIHIHSSEFNKFVFGGLLILFSARTKIKLLTIHSDISARVKIRSLKYVMIKNIMKCFDYIICVNEDQKRFFSERMNISASKLITIPSYIPIQQFPHNVSEEIKDFVKSIKTQIDYLVISSGYFTDIYGYDLIIDAIKNLTEFRIGIIFAFYTRKDHSYYKEIDKKLKSTKHIWTFQDLSTDDFFYLIRSSDLFIRANRIDTYGMVVGDSIELGTPVIASDVCPRHSGAILFASNNILDLTEKIKNTLLNIEEVKKQISVFKQENYAEDLLNFYQKILK